MMQGYVDDSGGKGQGKVFILSSLFADAEEWAAISDQWDICLKESPSIRYFKMYEADQCNGEFRGFLSHERDEKLKKLCRIINTPKITELSLTLDLEDFSTMWAPQLGRPACEPYFIPFQFMNQIAGHEVLRQGKTEPCEIFFDEQVIFGPRAKAWYPIVKASAEPHVRAVMPVEPFFRSDRETLPLQAADLTAWMHRRANNDGLGEFEWLPEYLDLMKVSPLSRGIDAEWIKKMLAHEYTPEEKERHTLVMDAYRETFGFDWPPKNSLQEKKQRGK
jgi:Protein of unknown function (DUF3800)